MASTAAGRLAASTGRSGSDLSAAEGDRVALPAKDGFADRSRTAVLPTRTIMVLGRAAKAQRVRCGGGFVARDSDVVGLETPVVVSCGAVASGHVTEFSDPQPNAAVQLRFRLDHFVDGGDGTSPDELHEAFTAKHGEEGNCPAKGCKGTLSRPRPFNLLMSTSVGIVEDEGRTAYLRPETAQGAYAAYSEVARTSRKRVPFGIAQSGTSFRNEVTPGSFIFRTREFQQMELQWFCKDAADAAEAYDRWIDRCESWLLGSCGLRPENVRRRVHEDAELAHYAVATTDLEFKYPFGWGELWGIANRGDHDIRAHSRASGANLAMDSDGTFPHVVEPAVGLNRLILAMLCDAYDVETTNDGKGSRTVLRLAPHVAPFQAAVMCVNAKKPELARVAERAYASLSSWATADLDLGGGSIGKKYRRQDEIGTPYCITVDYDTLDDEKVTIRARDSMAQLRVPIDSLSTSILDDPQIRSCNNHQQRVRAKVFQPIPWSNYLFIYRK